MNYTEEQIKEIVRKVISEMSNVSLERFSREEKNHLAIQGSREGIEFVVLSEKK